MAYLSHVLKIHPLPVKYGQVNMLRSGVLSVTDYAKTEIGRELSW